MASIVVPNASDIFDGMVVYISPGAKVHDGQIGRKIASNGGLVVLTQNSRCNYVLSDPQDKTQFEGDPIVLSEDFFTQSIQLGSLRNEDNFVVDRSKKRAAPGSSATSSASKKQKKTSGPQLDPSCPYAASAHIYKDPKSGNYWTCTLNQSDLMKNSNKFYKIDLIESNAVPYKYSVWVRWGRVGYGGQNSLIPCSSLANAKLDFEKKFNQKTKNNWGPKIHDTFHAQSGLYTLLAIDWEDEDEEDDESATPVSSKAKPAAAASAPTAMAVDDEEDAEEVQSKLEPRIQDLVQMIFDKKMMANTVAAMNYDVKKMPLGKLATKTIKTAFKVLKQIEDILKAAPGNKSNSPKIHDLTNQFYTYIPHNAGMQRLPYIDNLNILNEKIQLLQTLEDIDVANKVEKEEKASVHTGPKLHPIDQQYKGLNLDLKPLERSDVMFPVLEKYVLNTHAPTHNMYTFKVMDIFDVHRDSEQADFQKYASLPNHQLLWHGSRMSNWVGILSQGLRIAPPEAPVTGYMFGKGVYFADSSSKSGNYCHTSAKDPIGLLLLCEVALGNMFDKTAAFYVNQLPAGFQSLRGLGTSEPDPKDQYVDKDGMIVPYGKQIPNPAVPKSDLLYNELIVYDIAQIRMRYLIKLRFNWK